jgi:hypothetical protein
MFEGGAMSASYAAAKFRELANESQNDDIRKLAVALAQLAQGISSDISSLERELHTIKNRVNSMRT